MNPFENLVEPVFVISRTFNSSRQFIWNAFTDSERMKKWWAPPGFEVIVSNMDFRPGGTYHYCLLSPEGFEIWGKLSYRQVEFYGNIVLILYFSNKYGDLSRHPFLPTWPLQMLSTFTFTDEADKKTALTIQWTPLSPTELERKTFQESTDKMNHAWDVTLNQLAKYLETERI